MFTKVRPKQEQFLWFVVEGMPATRAYAEAYGQHLSEATCAVNASKLLKQTKVVARRNELIAARHARTPVSVEFLSRELLAISGEARALGQGSAAVAAMMGVAKLHGLLVDKVQMDALVRKPTESPEAPAEMSEEDWLTKYGVVNLQPIDAQPMISTAEPLVVEAEPIVEE